MTVPGHRPPARGLLLLAAGALAAAAVVSGCQPKSPLEESIFRRAMQEVKSENAFDRRNGAELLQRCPAHAKEAIPVLIDKLKDDDVWVATFAAGSLTALTDQDFGPDQRSPERWRKWWYEEAKQKPPKIASSDQNSLNKTNAALKNDEGEMLLNGGNYARSADLFMEAIRRDGKVPRYHSNLGMAMLGLKDYDRALKCFQDAKAFDTKREFAAAYMNGGAVYAQRAQDLLAAAAEHAAAARAAEARGDEAAAKIEGQALVEQTARARQDEGRALQEFEYAIAIDKPGRLWAAHAEIGRIHLRRGDFETAVGPLTKAAEINPREPAVRRDLARVYYGLDQYYLAWLEIRAVQALGYDLDPGFVEKVKQQVRKMGGDPDALPPPPTRD